MYIYNTKDINGLISFRQITEADTIGTLVEKVNYNFDQILLFGGIKGDKGDKGDQGLPGATGRGRKGDKGDKGSNIYYENRAIVSNNIVTNPTDIVYVEDDIIIDITGSYYKVVMNPNSELVYSFLFNINNALSNSFTTQFDYEQLLGSNTIAKWVYKVDQSLSNSTQNTVLLVSKDSTDNISRLQRLVIGDDRYSTPSQNTSFVVANIIDDSDTTNQIGSQMSLGYRRDKNSPLSMFMAKHTVKGYDGFDSLYYNIGLADNSIRLIYGAGNIGDPTESKIAISTKKFSLYGYDQNFDGTYALDFVVNSAETTITANSLLLKLQSQGIELSAVGITLKSNVFNIGDGASTNAIFISDQTNFDTKNLKISSSTGIFDLDIITKTNKDLYINSAFVLKATPISLTSTVLAVGSSPIYIVSTASQQNTSTIASFSVANAKLNIGERITLIFKFYATLVHSSVLKLSRGENYQTYPDSVITFIHTGYDNSNIPMFTQESTTMYDKYLGLTNINNVWLSYNTDRQISNNISYNALTQKLKVKDISNLIYLSNITGLSNFGVINSINLIDKNSNTEPDLSLTSPNLYNGGYLVLNNDTNMPFVLRDYSDLVTESGLNTKGRIFLNGNSEILLKPKETVRLTRYVASSDYEWEVVGSAYMGYAETQIGTDTSKYFRIAEIEIKNTGSLTDIVNKDFSGTIHITQKNRDTTVVGDNIKCCDLHTTIRQNGVWSDNTTLTLNSYIEGNGIYSSDIIIANESIAGTDTKRIRIYAKCLDLNSYYSVTKIGRSEIQPINFYSSISTPTGSNPSINKWFEPFVFYNNVSNGSILNTNMGYGGTPIGNPNTPIAGQNPISVYTTTDEYLKTIVEIRNSSVNLGQNPELLIFRENGTYYGRGIRNLMNQTPNDSPSRFGDFPIDFPFNNIADADIDISHTKKYRVYHSSHTPIDEIEFTMEVSDGWYRDSVDSTNKFCQVQKFYFHNANLYPTDYLKRILITTFLKYDTGLCYSRRIFNSSSSTVDMLSKSSNTVNSSGSSKSLAWTIHHSGESSWMLMNPALIGLFRMAGGSPVSVDMVNLRFYVKFLNHYTAEIKFRFKADMVLGNNQIGVLRISPLKIYHPGDIDDFLLLDDGYPSYNNNGEDFYYPNTLSYLCGTVQACAKPISTNDYGATTGGYLASLVALPKLLPPFGVNDYDKSGLSIFMGTDDQNVCQYHGTGIISCKYTGDF